MIKKVNIHAKFPVRSITPPIYGEKNNVDMSTSDILMCLRRNAIVDEVLPNGNTIRLNYANYRDSHNTSIDEYENKEDTNDDTNNDESCNENEDHTDSVIDNEQVKHPKIDTEFIPRNNKQQNNHNKHKKH